jgi:phosphate:Na+ symporter
MNSFIFWGVVVNILYILGGLGIFLYGMRVMSDAITKIAGAGMRRIMASMTKNRFYGLLTGLFVTCLVQSSSATTVMVVSFVNAQLLTLTESIGVIMGANLGTTLTGWIIASVGKFSLSKIALPIIGIGFPFIFSKKAKFKHTGEFLVGFGLLFFGLSELKNAVPDVKSLLQSSDPRDLQMVREIQATIEQLNSHGFGSILIFLVIGILLTIVVQSSSAAMGITIILAVNGWINFEIAAAIVLGENIGTTITAWLASIGTSVCARRAARAHLIFNVVGTLWMLLLFYPFVSMIDNLMPGAIFAEDVTSAELDSHYSKNGIEGEPQTDEIARAKKFIIDTNIPLHLSLFHTMFNLCNIGLLIGFAPMISRTVERMVKDDKDIKTS